MGDQIRLVTPNIFCPCHRWVCEDCYKAMIAGLPFAPEEVTIGTISVKSECAACEHQGILPHLVGIESVEQFRKLSAA